MLYLLHFNSHSNTDNIISYNETLILHLLRLGAVSVRLGVDVVARGVHCVQLLLQLQHQLLLAPDGVLQVLDPPHLRRGSSMWIL